MRDRDGPPTREQLFDVPRETEGDGGEVRGPRDTAERILVGKNHQRRPSVWLHFPRCGKRRRWDSGETDGALTL